MTSYIASIYCNHDLNPEDKITLPHQEMSFTAKTFFEMVTEAPFSKLVDLLNSPVVIEHIDADFPRLIASTILGIHLEPNEPDFPGNMVLVLASKERCVFNA